MLPLSSAFLLAAGADAIIERTYVSIDARNRTSGATVTRGFHADLAPPSTADVIDGRDGLIYTREFRGGSLVSVSAVQCVSDLSIAEATIVLAATRDDVDELVRGLDVRLAPVQIAWGLANLSTRDLVDPAVPIFIGKVDRLTIATAAEGGDSTATLVCVSTEDELNRASTDVRSAASQRRRAPGDRFYDYVNQEFHPRWGPAMQRPGKRKR